MTRSLRVWACVPVLLLGLACASGGSKEDPLLMLSSAEALEQGKALLEEGKYRQARDMLTHAFEVEPNSVGGREALLLAADAYYQQGGPDNYVRAESKYRDFQTRFPTSNQAAYVQFKIASSLAKRVKRGDRDQSETHEAIEEFTAVIELYPTSQYVDEARAEISRVRQNLADHEFHVGHFYMRYGNFNGATARLEHLVEEYPDYDDRDRALWALGMTYRKSDREEDSRKIFQQLAEEYPDSRWAHKIPKPDPG